MEIQKLFVSLLLDAADYTGGLDDAQKQASSWSDRLRKSIGNGLKTAGTIATTALAAIATTAAGVAVASALAFTGFQGQMNEVFTLLPGISEDAMDEMSGQVLQFSKDFAVLPEEVVPALYQSLSAGVPQDNVFSFLEIAQKAAVGGVTELETAVDGITSVMNAYGSDVVDAAKASDVMFTAVRLGKTDFEQLSASLFNVIPTAASLGIEFGDVAAQLATLTAQGTPTSVATTQIRAAMVEASKSGTKLSDAIQELTGESFADLIQSGESMPAIFNDLRDSMPEQEFKDLFGSVEAMNAVLGVTGPNFDTVSAAMDEMADSAGATDAAYDTMNKGIGRSVERMKAFGQATLIQIGGALEPVINAVLGFAEGALPKIENVLNTAVIPAIETVTTAVGNMFTRLESGNGIVYALTELFHDLGLEELGIWFQGAAEQATALFDQVRNAVQPLLDAAVGFVEWQDVLIALGIVLASVILPILGSLLLSIAAIAAPVLAIIAVVALLRHAWENNWGGIQEKTAAAVEFIRGVITSVMAGVQAFWAQNGEAIMAKAQEIWTGIQTAVNTAITTIQNIITTISTAIQTFWATHGETIMTAAQTAWDFISSYVETALAVVSSVFAAFKSAFEGDWRGFGENLRAAWDTAWEFVKTTFTNAKNTIITIAAGLVLDLIAKFQNTDWGAVGRAIIDGIANGIRNGAGAIAEAARAAAQAALDAAKGFLGIQSPSKVFTEVGRNIGQGLVNGIAMSEQSVQDATRRLFQVGGSLSGIAGGFAGQLQSGLMTDLKAIMDARGPQLESLMGSVAEKLGLDDVDMLNQNRLIKAYFDAVHSGNDKMKREIEAIWQTQNELNSATAEYESAQADILALQKAQSDLAFLKQQQDLLDLIAEHGLDAADILGGLELGLGADTQGLVQAMTRAIQAIIKQANEQLDISSPSGVFKEIGQLAMRGLADGLGDVGPIRNSVADLVDEMTLPFATVQPTINTTSTPTAVSSPAPTAGGGGGDTFIIQIPANPDHAAIEKVRGIIREEWGKKGRNADVRIRTG